jgi:hypothetical protein
MLWELNLLELMLRALGAQYLFFGEQVVLLELRYGPKR